MINDLEGFAAYVSQVMCFSSYWFPFTGCIQEASPYCGFLYLLSGECGFFLCEKSYVTDQMNFADPPHPSIFWVFVGLCQNDLIFLAFEISKLALQLGCGIWVLSLFQRWIIQSLNVRKFFSSADCYDSNELCIYFSSVLDYLLFCNCLLVFDSSIRFPAIQYLEVTFSWRSGKFEAFFQLISSLSAPAEEWITFSTVMYFLALEEEEGWTEQVEDFQWNGI